MLIRAILPDWAKNTGLPNVIEKNLSELEVQELNRKGYNIYFFPNYSEVTIPLINPVSSKDINDFKYLFIDMDLKDKIYKNKDEFLQVLQTFNLPPNMIMDSGNGIHVYWQVSGLLAKDYLKLQRRLARYFKTDLAVGKLAQLMRYPESVNTKDPTNPKLTKIIHQKEYEYEVEQFDKLLPPLSLADLQYVEAHYNQVHNINESIKLIDIPMKFMHLLRSNNEVKNLWTNTQEDRSSSDFRLAHIMYANNFTREEALAVLSNCAKAVERKDHHRINYAQNIIDKIWIAEKSSFKTISNSVREILAQKTQLRGTRFSCYSYIDNTDLGFRLGQVLGLVGGSGAGKTTLALNMFLGFVEHNPEYTHFFVSLEQPAEEISYRWSLMCGENDRLHDKIHIISNYDKESGMFRHLSLEDIQNYILAYEKEHKVKVGCVCIDHIGALKKQGKNGENQGLMDICHLMKAFAIQTNTLLIMQSQSPREKAGIGDIELDKDAAYGTVFFESYCDYLITLWQPLKRCSMEPGCPTVMAFKFCKIRHKNQLIDTIKEDVRYKLYYDVKNERLREMTQDEDKSFSFFNVKAVNKRKQDKRNEVLTYESVPRTENNNQDKS